MNPMIEVENLTKYYGPVLAVDNISFDVAPGKIVGFLGPNGAGKSTTLKILTCFLAASGGRARVAGFNVFSQSLEVRKRIGYLPENVPMYPDMRVRDYLKFRAQLKGIAAHERRTVVEQAADRCWLRKPMDVMDRQIGHLSKGYRQRVGLADAIMHEPAVLVLDEPSIGLDPTQTREMRALIRELGDKHTVIFSSHILSEVEQICSDIIIIAGGKIVATGEPATLREQMTGQSRLLLEIGGADGSPIVSAIRKIAGVKEAAVLSSQDGWSQLSITPTAGQDPRDAIFQAVVGAGWKLRDMRRLVPTLEDFFVQITAMQQLRGRAS